MVPVVFDGVDVAMLLVYIHAWLFVLDAVADGNLPAPIAACDDRPCIERPLAARTVDESKHIDAATAMTTARAKVL